MKRAEYVSTFGQTKDTIALAAATNYYVRLKRGEGQSMSCQLGIIWDKTQQQRHGF
jgi:hypothetical protein